MNLFNKNKQNKEATNNNIDDNLVNLVYTNAMDNLYEKFKGGSNLELLTKPELYVYVFTNFASETYNGGFEQFLFNSTGELYGLLFESLNNIGFDNIIKMYKPIKHYFPNELPKEESERDQVLFAIFDKHKNLSKKINKCDKKFYDIDELTNQAVVYNYIMNNKDSFDPEITK